MYYLKFNDKDKETVEMYEEYNTLDKKLTRFMAIFHVDCLSMDIINDLKVYDQVAVNLLRVEE